MVLNLRKETEIFWKVKIDYYVTTRESLRENVDSMEQCTSLGANRSSPGQEISRILWTLNVQNGIHKRPTHVVIHSQISRYNPIPLLEGPF